MAEKLKQVEIKETKQNLFNILKAGVAAALIGTKVWADVEDFTEDPSDTSKLVLKFKPEPEV